MTEQLNHCLIKMLHIAEMGDVQDLTARDIFQFGYNTGRAAELAGEGREQWWDQFKDSVAEEAWHKVYDIVLVKMQEHGSD
ncbi:MAG: hypothetical protein QF473_26740 [Planctomycetota bacterium]|jgi:hypothetical protein|nr:hypothetical protein [Planctomycetota bacterium]